MKKVFTIAKWQKDPGQKVVNSKGEEINVCEKSLGWIMAHTLYIVDEPEPTEFAVQLEQMLYDWEERGIEARKIVGDWTDKLLSLAREQLIHEGYIIEKKAFHDAVEKVEPDILKEISERVDAKIGSTEELIATIDMIINAQDNGMSVLVVNDNETQGVLYKNATDLKVTANILGMEVDIVALRRMALKNEVLL